jgi:hypothetical protein
METKEKETLCRTLWSIIRIEEIDDCKGETKSVITLSLPFRATDGNSHTIC